MHHPPDATLTRAPASRSDRIARVAPQVSLSLLAALVLFWDVGRPAPWVDETATLSAVQRSWSGLLALLGGADAPLVPFYAAEKLFRTAVKPAASGWIVDRIVPVLCAVAVVWIFTGWIRRRHSWQLAVLCGLVLLALAGLSRYAQEARPYSLDLLFATWSWVEWDRLRRSESSAGAWRYAISIVALGLAQVLGLVQVVAQVGVVFLLRGPHRPVVRTATAAVIIGVPWTIWVAVHGLGPAHPVSYTLSHIGATFLGMLSADNRGVIAGGVVVLLAIVGLTAAHSPGLRELVLVGLAWALAAPVLLTILAAVRPAILERRYWLTSVPGWALLCGIGVWKLASLVATRVSARSAVLLAAAVVVGVAAVELPAQRDVRSAAGHGDDIRPAVRLVTTGPYAAIPLTFGEYSGPLVVMEYDPALATRVVGWTGRPTGARVWPARWTSRRTRRALAGHTSVLLVLRTPLVYRGRLGAVKLSAFVERHVPAALIDAGYTVSQPLLQRSTWIVAVVSRH